MQTIKRLTCICILFMTSSYANEPVIGGPCQGCENVFINIPEKLTANARIAPIGQKGEPLKVIGTVFNQEGEKVPNTIVYAYQTDAEGKYPAGVTFHGRLRGWALTDHQGAYSFNTIRPVAYPNGREPQHIHLHIIEPNKGTYYIDDITFSDDPLLSVEEKSKTHCRGGCGLTTPALNKSAVWQVERNIILGKNIPNYK